jgi:type II secretion system protein D
MQAHRRLYIASAWTIFCSLAFGAVSGELGAQEPGPMPRSVGPQLAGPMTLAYPLRHAQPADLMPIVSQVMAGQNPQAQVTLEPGTNRLIVQGTEADHQLARQVISAIDLPTPNRPAPPPPEAQHLQGYRVAPEHLNAWADDLNRRYGAVPGIRVAPDPRTGQLVVLAPPTVHQEIGAILQSNAAPMPAPAEPPAYVQPRPGAVPAAQPGLKPIRLQYADGGEIMGALRRLFHGRWQDLPEDGSGVFGAHLLQPDEDPVLILFHPGTQELAFDGPADAADQLRRLVQTLDAPARTQADRVHLVTIRHADPDQVRWATAAYKQANDQVQQPAQPAQPEIEDPGPIGPVQIEYIPGLDAFVVRGNAQDVARVVAIIEQIERVSVDNEPRLEIYQLRNVGSQQMAELVRQIYDEILLPRQGQVSITELIKPNALLLIGQSESVQTVMELIERLDQPVQPGTQFEVYRLKHAGAQAAQATLQEFFAERPQLGTRVLVTADYRTNSLLIQASPRDMAEAILLLKKIDSPENQAVNELRVFPLQNSLADDLAPVLLEAIGQATTGAGIVPQVQQPGAQGAAGGTQKSSILRFLTIDAAGQKKIESGILTDVRITPDPRANALLVSAPPESMELLSTLIRQLDQFPAAQSQIKVFTILNGDAFGLATVLQDLFGSQQTGGGLGALQAGGLVAGETSLVPLRFSVDQRTNSIIVSGSPDDLIVVEALLLRLDEDEVRDRETVVYRLKNAPALDVATAIQDFLFQQREQVLQLDPNLINPFERLEREVVVVAEPVTNSLIVSATPRYFAEVQKIIDQLDARPPMVLIQVLLADVTLAGTDEFGIEMGIQSSVLFDRGIVGTDIVGPGFRFVPSELPNNSPSSPSVIGGQGYSNFGVGRSNPTLGFGGLVLSASSESVSFLLRALRQRRRVDVLARPQVMTLDNQPAFIQVGQRVPVVTSSTTNQNGQTSNVRLENVGLILGVTPRVSPDNLVVMEIDAERSEVGPDAEGIPISISPTGDVIRSPRINTTTAQTTVSARNGQTIILGGLIRPNRSVVHRTVPVLDQIPVIKHLFRYDLEEVTKNELLIIMTPHIVRSEADADRLKAIEAGRMHWCLQDVEHVHGDLGLHGAPYNIQESNVRVIRPEQDAEGNLIFPELINPGDVEPLPPPPPGPMIEPTSGVSRTPQKPSVVTSRQKK